MMSDPVLTQPTVVPLGPLENSHAANDLESELKAAFMAVFEAMIRPRLDAINSYGMAHRGSMQTVERVTKAAGLAMERVENADAYMVEVYRAWTARNPRRGVHFLRHYLQMLWPGLTSLDQLWFDPEKVYPRDCTTTRVGADDILTSRVRVTIADDDSTGEEMSKLSGSFRAVLPARLVIEMQLQRRMTAGLRIGGVAHGADLAVVVAQTTVYR